MPATTSSVRYEASNLIGDRVAGRNIVAREKGDVKRIMLNTIAEKRVRVQDAMRIYFKSAVIGFWRRVERVVSVTANLARR